VNGTSLPTVSSSTWFLTLAKCRPICAASIPVRIWAISSLTIDPQYAIRYYEDGLRIGELPLGNNFPGVLRWGHIENRAFLRCMHGDGLCLWRLGCFEEAERVFDRMLWLNPPDNQGVRFLIDEVKAKTAWEDRENE
jgi:hypothetical protein